MRLASLLVLFALPATAQDTPTRAAQRKAFESALRSQVVVAGPSARGPGVFIGVEGQVLTSVHHVALERAQVFASEGEPQEGKVLFADARLKVAVVSVAVSRAPAAAVRPQPVEKGTWLVAVRRTASGKTAPVHGRVKRLPTARAPFLEAGLAVPPGTALFDGKGQLVAVSVARKGARCLALPVLALKPLLANAAP